jgi:two-component system cell cycle response regulator
LPPKKEAQVKILLAEDDPVSRHILSESLRRWGYEVYCAADGQEAWLLLQEHDAPQLAVLDWMMPGLDGIDLCRRIRERSSEPYVYVLLLTSKGQKQDVIQGMGAGADDYILKPFDPGELQTRLNAGRRIIRLQADLLEARESLRYLATHDSLTGLLNRGEILNRLHSEIDRSLRDSSSVGLLIADIDHFKLVNDTLGHVQGDNVLIEIAARMRSGVRSYDAVGRYGGEEFLIILPGCDSASAAQQAERLRALIADQPVTLIQESIRLTLSIGVAAKEGGRLANSNQLVQAADEALYRAKAAGRNRIALASAEPAVRPEPNGNPSRPDSVPASLAQA